MTMLVVGIVSFTAREAEFSYFRSFVLFVLWALWQYDEAYGSLLRKCF